jgi:hypothetical protein
MKNILLTIIIFTLSVGIAHAEAVVDITKVAGKSQKEVATYLGKEISCSHSKYGKKCQYKKGETEIVFIKGKADWITVEGIDNVPFSKSAITALGLKETRPSFKSNFTLRWEPIQGLRSVSVFKGTSNSDYAYIKVKTN